MDADSKPDGLYHIDGELVVAPQESFLHTLKTSLPLFKLASGRQAVLLTPLPRYWLTNCCQDPEHITNRADGDFEEVLFTGLDNIRRQCKDFLFKNGLSNVRVLNTAQLICGSSGSRTTLLDTREQLSAAWGEDPVHPSAGCFSDLAVNLTSYLNIQKTENIKESCSSELQRPGKRPRWLEEAEASTIRPNGHAGGRGWRGRGRPGRWRGRRPFK